jgi:glycosyltransferase involved in cell wall biosynthesis
MSAPEQRCVVDYGVDVAAIDRYRANLDRRRTRAARGWLDDDIVIALIGVFEGRKAQAAMVAAFEELANVHPRIRLALVGLHVGGYSEAVVAQIARSAHADRIHVEPITPDIHSWYALSDLLVCASDIESLPRSILEAMAFELPVVSTDVFGVATLLEDGVTGWLTQVGDLRSLTATLHHVLRLDPNERRAVATRARAEVERRSGEQAYGSVLGRTLAELLDHSDAPLRHLAQQPSLSTRGMS